MNHTITRSILLITTVLSLSSSLAHAQKNNRKHDDRPIVSTAKSASLDQSMFHPFAGSATISYTLPNEYSTAEIIIADMNGQTLRQADVSGNGKGLVNIDVSALSSGTYRYPLLVDGQWMDTKLMMLTK